MTFFVLRNTEDGIDVRQWPAKDLMLAWLKREFDGVTSPPMSVDNFTISDGMLDRVKGPYLHPWELVIIEGKILNLVEKKKVVEFDVEDRD